MNSQDFRNLQEAYLDVYENEQLDEMPYRVFTKQDARGNQRARAALTPNERKQLNMEFDFYDLVLSHLLDEGYADTNENALVIMANMSEDWRESILSESLSIDRRIRFREIDKKNRREGKKRAADGDTSQQEFDATSFGKGNKATRRQGYNVTDTSTWPDQEGRRSEHDSFRGVKRKKSGNANYQQQPK